ncbi:MAG: substrate-binding domain-containing protein [Clostridiaceae bacterium]|jgi:ABC-type sugar transport system substrate-binding protein|nr:substrate-binding domain-containing protein [Clostridiaceae bacterium]
MRKLLAVILCLAIVLSGGCSGEDPHSVPGSAEDNLIVVGFSQVGAESEWRVTNTENIKSVLSEDNGYMLIFDDARQEQENQIRAIRMFIQQDVDYIVFSPKVETGWNSILLEAKEAGIPVIVIDRYLEQQDNYLYTAYVGSDFYREGEIAVKWLEDFLEEQGRAEEPIRIVHIQGTIGSTPQLGRTVPLENAVKRHPNWEIVAQELGDFTKAKAYEVMSSILKSTQDIDVVYCENDGEALGAIAAMEEAGLKCNPEDGVIVISFDATRLGLEYTLAGKIALNVECNPLQGPYVDKVIKKLERGEYVDKINYVDETYFDYRTITREIIDSRAY